MKFRAFSLVAALLFALVPLALSQTSSDSPAKTAPNQTATPASASQAAAPQSPPPANAPQDQTSGPTAQEQTPASGPQDAAASAPARNVPEQQKDPKVKEGTKEDVNAIGNRNVGKGVNWYSLEKEIRMGKEFAQQVEASARLVQDPVVNEFVNRVGQNLVRNSDARVPFTIKVIDSDEINAFALPGGFFYVNSGLILAADEEAELAGVMAHEIAHVAARHATRQMTRGQLANFASLPLIFMGGGIGYAIGSAAGIGLPLTFMSFSRGFEAEADYLGLEYMYKTGYDPQAFIAFFEKIQAKEKKKPGTLSKAFASHPQTPDRIARSQQEIARVLPARPEYVVTTSEFDDVKARLAAIENRHKLEDKKDNGNRPTLRRTTNDGGQGSGSGTSSDGKDTASSQQDDGRPTLKRRDQD